MVRVTEKEVEFIFDDLGKRGIVLDDLKCNLLDHVCCIIESEKPADVDFLEFYEHIILRFFKKELKEIQDETDMLLTYKNYFAMKKTLYTAGSASALLTLLGAVLKTMHWPGAGICLVLGAALFSLVFVPLMIALKFKDDHSRTDKLIFSLGGLLGGTACVGVMFKLMHWPYANLLMISSITLFVFVYVPIYFLSKVRKPDQKLNGTVNSVLMMACGGMLYALFNLGFSKSIEESLTDSNKYMIETSQQLRKANDGLKANNKLENELLQASSEIVNRIDAIKTRLIAVSNNCEQQEVDLNQLVIKRPNDYHTVEALFEKGNDEFSLSHLLKALEQYNNCVSKYLVGRPERIIKCDEDLFKKSVLSNTLQNLTQIQLQILNAENTYLLLAGNN